MTADYRKWILSLAAATAGLGVVDFAQAGSIQQPGMTTGLPEGFAPTEGLYGVTMLNFGGYNANGSWSNSTVGIPAFLTWSTPWEPLGARLEFKAAPFVFMDMNGQSMRAGSLYNPYVGAWLSWFVGNGFNFAIGEGVQIGVDTTVDNATGRNFNAFQQNVALSYVRNNLDLTANAFYTTGNTSVWASQPETFNVDLTATKKDGRLEYGLVGYGEWDLNRPNLRYGPEQSEFAVGGLVGYLLGNQISGQLKLTHAVYERNMGGNDTRLWGQLIIPLWTPPAPAPRNAK